MEHMEQIYEHIKKHIQEKGFPPSGRQIADALKLNYEDEVSPAIDKLIDDGRIKIEDAKEELKKMFE